MAPQPCNSQRLSRSGGRRSYQQDGYQTAPSYETDPRTSNQYDSNARQSAQNYDYSRVTSHTYDPQRPAANPGYYENNQNYDSRPSQSRQDPHNNNARRRSRSNDQYQHQQQKRMSSHVTSAGPRSQSSFRKHFVAATGEFVGTFLFLLFAFLGHSMAVNQATEFGADGTNSSQTVVFIAMSYGLSLLVTAWTLYRVSGGLYNPAVTLALVVTGNLPWVRGLIFFPAQILGAICAAAVVKGIIPSDVRLVQTTLAPGISLAQGVFLEMFLTAELTFTVLMLAAEKSKDTFIAPIGIGMALFVAEIAGVYYTGASLNPARSFGPCVVSPYFTTYHWIYWIGPILGALVAAGYYHFIKYLNYEEANPEQDSSGGGFGSRMAPHKRHEKHAGV